MAESGQVPGLDGFLVSVPTCDVHAPDVPIAADCMVPDEENAKDKKNLEGKDKAIALVLVLVLLVLVLVPKIPPPVPSLVEPIKVELVVFPKMLPLVDGCCGC
jgi:hypothetical protein